ncbi:hypothetical protein M422DRAFT_782299 [Sphaerobolus stellatus SS14]|uniref:Uncharacterized protein n=1 Tax=Sphaerobolus stellatus (strain SS14) TaxID=990650 RepID=A0A0C9UMZ6_SPHS4|nr:hypothetical protein M422DRAFT_782299 [Sphaerobolus stellatus SS14]
MAKMVPKSARTVGATYSLTNEQTGNFIVSSAIGADGKLSPGQITWVGDNGAHGLDGPPGPDATFNGASDIYAMMAWIPHRFEIDASDPTKLHPIGQPTNSGGEFPVSVAISKTGQICVLDGARVNGVASFKLNQITPATGASGSVSQLAFNHEESKLLVAVKGFVDTKNPGYIDIWDVVANGRLSQTFPRPAATLLIPKDDLLPWSITQTLGKDAIVSADAGIGYNVIDFTTNTSDNGAVEDWSTSEAARYSNSAPTNFAMFRKRGEISARRNGRAKTGSDLPPPGAISVAS